MFKISSSKPRSNSRFMSQCKKHPKHRQSPGVCSLCLSEKLSRVSSSSFSSSGSRVKRARAYYYCSSSSLSSSEDESSYASSCASPDARDAAGGYYHRRIASDVMRPEMMRRSDDVDDRFGKSRSMMRSGESKNSNVISGFWSKLLRPRKRTGSHLNKMMSQSQPLAASSSSMAVC